MRETLTDRFRFLRAFLANPRQVGAILPTSRWAVRAMLDLADVRRAELVVELGAGTGVQTGEILNRLAPGARLVSLEIDPALAELRRRVLDLLPVALAPGGVLLVLQYSPFILGELRRRFPSVQQTITPWNVPPAFIYACRADAS